MEESSGLFCPFVSPYAIFSLFRVVWMLPRSGRKKALRPAGTAILAYVLIAYPLTRWTEYDLRSTIGLPISQGAMFKLAIFPNWPFIVGLSFELESLKARYLAINQFGVATREYRRLSRYLCAKLRLLWACVLSSMSGSIQVFPAAMLSSWLSRPLTPGARRTNDPSGFRS
jgi:hypothetical protein